jgi:predicted ATPase/transcriptional regulator with XRE-family HTH domain
MHTPPSFGVWLKLRRKSLDLTQAALAARVGCAAVTIRKLEAEVQRPSRQLAELLAQHLDIPADEWAAFVQLARVGLDTPPNLPPARNISHPSPLARAKLPLPATPLIGREHEIAMVCELLQRADVRLLTLIGPGGVGKTRLALAAATELAPSFADGVVFIDLSPIRDAALVGSAIAQALEVQEQGRQPLAAVLAHVLRDRHMLLVLDNVEQVVAAAPLLAELLAAAPQTKWLLTSRSVVGIYGEYTILVPPLMLPDLNQLPPINQVQEIEAVRLFVARAQASKPGFHLNSSNTRIVCEICDRLDGLPLAIELAATRMRVFTPYLLLQRLSSRLTVLTQGPRTLPARQQTLRDTIAWSYGLLNAPEQMLFRRLAVFVGGCTLHAVEAICNVDGDLASDELEVLTSLLDKSLLQQRESSDGELCFTMLETIREYAFEQLLASAEFAAIQQQHAHFFTTFAEVAKPWLSTPQHVIWFDRLEQEHPNLRVALAWYQAMPKSDRGLRLAIALSDFWIRHNHLNEARSWFTAAIAQDDARAVDTADNMALRARAYEWLGVIANWQVDLPTSQSWLEASLKLYQELGDARGIAEQYRLLGILAQMRGEYQHSRELLDEALFRHQQRENPHDVAWCLFFLGILNYEQGHTKRAWELMDAALITFRAEQDTWIIIMLLTHEGMVALDLGDYRQVRMCLMESLTLLQELPDRWLMVHAIEVCAALAVAEFQQSKQPQMDRFQAARLFGAAEALRAMLGTPLMPVYQSHYQRSVAAARRQVDASAFTTAWAQGRMLTLEQAIDQALAIATESTERHANIGAGN